MSDNREAERLVGMLTASVRNEDGTVTINFGAGNPLPIVQTPQILHRAGMSSL